MDNTPKPGSTTPNLAVAGTAHYDRDDVKASITKNNASPIGALLVGVDEFLASEPVRVKINAGNGLEFTAKNELGAEYQFKATGQFDLIGNVVTE